MKNSNVWTKMFSGLTLVGVVGYGIAKAVICTNALKIEEQQAMGIELGQTDEDIES